MEKKSRESPRLQVKHTALGVTDPDLDKNKKEGLNELAGEWPGEVGWAFV